MKQILRKTGLIRPLLLMLVLLLGGGNAKTWAESYTITFKTGTGDGSAASVSTPCSDIVSDGSNYLSGNLALAEKVYYNGSYGLKLGTSSVNGKVTMKLASNITPTSIVVNAKLYNSSKTATISINDKTAQTMTADFADYTFAFSSEEISQIKLTASKYCWVKSVTINYETSGGESPSYTVTTQANNNAYGTVTVNGNVITAVPATGYTYADPAYTVTDGTATVTQNGNAFTVTPSTDCTVQINFAALPTYTVTLGDNNATLTEASAGAGVTLPSREAIDDYTFAGWSTTDVTEETTNAPTIIPAGNYTPNDNITLYPIYSKIVTSGASETTASVTIADYAKENDWVSDKKYHVVNLDGQVSVTTNEKGTTGQYNSNSNYWGMYQTSQNASELTVTATSGTLKSVSFTYTSNNTGILVYNGTQYASGAVITLSGQQSSTFTVGNTGTATNGQARITAISVTYESEGVSTTYYWSSPVAKTASNLTKTGDITLSMAAPNTTATASNFFSTSSTGSYTYTIANPSVATVDENGVVTPVAAGTTILTVNQAADATHYAGSITINVTVEAEEMATPTFNIENELTLSYGETLTLTQSSDPNSSSHIITNGSVSFTATPQGIVTFNGLEIAATAAGTATITLTTTATANFESASKAFTIEVTAPEGRTDAFVGESAQQIFYETFAECHGTGEAGSFKGTGNDAIVSDQAGWTFTKANAANGCGKFGSSSAAGSAKTPSISTVNGATYTLTFKAAPWDNDANTSMNVAVNGGTITGISEDEMTTQAWNEYTATITATGNAINITFSASENRFFLDDVVLTKPATTFSESVKFNASGYATYCSQYPLDFTNAEGYTAWQITSISSDNVITFEKVAGSVKGGTGLLLKGAAGATVTLTSADSETALSDNKLVGTLAPTYISAGQYYGLSGKTFVKVNAGTVPAGKALLPASLVNENTGGNVKAFTFVFNDLTTGVNAVDNGQWTMDNGAIFDLSGRRLSKPAKGINIINGKKVVVK